jgi:hypothetical protein
MLLPNIIGNFYFSIQEWEAGALDRKYEQGQ